MPKPHQPFLITIVDRDKKLFTVEGPTFDDTPGTRRKRKLAPQGARWMSSLIRAGTPSTARNLPHKAPLSTRRSAIRVSEISDVFRQARSLIRNPSDERAYCRHRRCPLAAHDSVERGAQATLSGILRGADPQPEHPALCVRRDSGRSSADAG